MVQLPLFVIRRVPRGFSKQLPLELLELRSSFCANAINNMSKVQFPPAFNGYGQTERDLNACFKGHSAEFDYIYLHWKFGQRRSAMRRNALRVYTLIAATLQSVLVISVVVGVVFLFLLAFGVAAQSTDPISSFCSPHLLDNSHAEKNVF